MAIKFSKGAERERRVRNDRNRQESDNDEMDESGISEDDDDQVSCRLVSDYQIFCNINS